LAKFAPCPRGEDWVWSTPVASQQIVTMMMDMFMAGVREYPPVLTTDPYAANTADGAPYSPVVLKPTEPARPILMYIMPVRRNRLITADVCRTLSFLAKLMVMGAIAALPRQYPSLVAAAIIRRPCTWTEDR
jgi:hypothetical protein